MHYSIQFFGLDAKTIGTQFASTPTLFAQQVEQRLRDENQFSEEDIQDVMTKVTAICGGQLPKKCDAEYMDAFCWLMEDVAEKITIGSFVGFRHLQFLDDTGIWPWLLRSPPPFAVPVCENPPPQVGFISADEMERLAMSGTSQLPPADCEEVNYARQEFLEVLESLSSDKLDLLAVLLA